MLTLDDLKQISLYTIDKKDNDTFNEPLDTTRLDDPIITTYAINTINKQYDNQRELEFNYISSNDTQELIADHSIAEKIQTMLNDEGNSELFKEKSQSIARILFGHTPSNAKKGDLLSTLFKMTDKYYLVLLKIDENKVLQRGDHDLWNLTSGLDTQAKLQKAVYIEIPILDTSYQENYLLWKIKAIDNISNDSRYWNIDFLEAHYKSDSKINSERFNTFFKVFITTISDPIKRQDLTFSYRSYLKTNENFEIDEFTNGVFGTASTYDNEKIRFRESILEACNHSEKGFDLVFDFHQSTMKKEYESKGAFTFDNIIKIVPTIVSGNQEDDRNLLLDTIDFGKGEEEGSFNDDKGKYVKVYYDDYDFDFK